MKKAIHLSLLFIVLISLAGCFKKDVYLPTNIAGAWVIDDAARLKSYGWQSFNTGLENGVFDLYSNGSAAFSDSYGSYVGSWNISDSYGNYYDANGDYRNGYHQSLYIRLYDRINQSNINLSFENIEVYNNRFITTDYYNGYLERYEFGRY